MTPERIQELRDEADLLSRQTRRPEMMLTRQQLDECLDEIERLQHLTESLEAACRVHVFLSAATSAGSAGVTPKL